MMDTVNDEFFVHSYGEYRIAFFEFFIPTIVGIVVREYELFSHAVAAAEDNCAAFPVHTRVMAFKPIMPEVDVLLAEVGYGEVDSFSMISDGQAEFDELGDVPALIAGSVGVIDWNRNERLFRV